MKRMGMLQIGMHVLACLGMIIPAPLLQAALTAPVPSQVDVQLHQGGVLLGQVVDFEGRPVGAARVVLHHLDRQLAATVTDQSGYFLVRGLRGGIYEIVTGQACGTYRIWAPNTAPPSAQQGVLLVVGGQGVRGQGPIGHWLGKPWVIAGLVAAAVAIPVGVHNHRVHRTASP